MITKPAKACTCFHVTTRLTHLNIGLRSQGGTLRSRAEEPQRSYQSSHRQTPPHADPRTLHQSVSRVRAAVSSRQTVSHQIRGGAVAAARLWGPHFSVARQSSRPWPVSGSPFRL